MTANRMRPYPNDDRNDSSNIDDEDEDIKDDDDVKDNPQDPRDIVNILTTRLDKIGLEGVGEFERQVELRTDGWRQDYRQNIEDEVEAHPTPYFRSRMMTVLVLASILPS